MPQRRFQMHERAFGTREVDQQIRVGENLLDIVRQQNARLLAEERACVLAELRRSGSVKRTGQRGVGVLENGFYEHAAHAARCAGDGDFHGVSRVS
jgi:hypothetical protein